MSTKAITAAKDALGAANEELATAQEKERAATLTLHKAYEEQEHQQAEPVKHPGPVNLRIENDYMSKTGRWNGPNTSVRSAAPTPAELDAIRAKSTTKPQKTFAERAREAEAKGETLKPSVTILSR